VENSRPKNQNPENKRLGLALSGGGFRASFFHLGVLQRLAELDLLRELNVISTVSGGSILGGLYYWKFKREFEQNGGCLSREDYEDIVREVKKILCAGVRRSPRNLLFMDFLGNLKSMATGLPWGLRMACLYRNLFFRGSELPPLTELKLKSAKVSLLEGRQKRKSNSASTDIETFNEKRVLKGPANSKDLKMPARVPKLVINSTCLNSGTPFLFTFAEVGAENMGFIRFDEVDLVLAFKYLKRLISKYRGKGDSTGILDVVEFIGRKTKKSFRLDRMFVLRLAVLWSALNEAEWTVDKTDTRKETKNPKDRFTDCVKKWNDKFSLFPGFSKTKFDLNGLGLLEGLENWNIVRRLLNAKIGDLRRAKIAAWYYLHKKIGGEQGKRYAAQFEPALDSIEKGFSDEIRKYYSLTDIPVGFYKAVAAVYFFRSAEVFSCDAKQALAELTLTHAVAASANFPPIFDPFEIYRLYDPQKANVLRLTDGGVYDNQGMETLIDENCTHMILSDAGGLLENDKEPSANRVLMMKRIIDVLMGTLRYFQLEGAYKEKKLNALASGKKKKNHPLKAIAFFHMASDPADAAKVKPAPLPPHAMSKQIAEIRTDLNSFDENEINALVYQGYQLSDRFIRKYILLRKNKRSCSPKPIAPEKNPDSNVERAVLASANSLFRLFPALALIKKQIFYAVVFVAPLLLWYFVHNQNYLRLKYIFNISFLGNFIAGWVGPFLKKNWVFWGLPWDQWWVLLLLAGLIILYFVWPRILPHLHSTEICGKNLREGEKLNAGEERKCGSILAEPSGCVRRLFLWIWLLPLWGALLLFILGCLLFLFDWLAIKIVRAKKD
jgi:predicted acylesterase/phospholipase RssA